MVWLTTLGAIVVPVWITIRLWKKDKARADFREQDRASREFIRQLDDLSGDKFAIVKFSALPEMLDAFNGAVPLGVLVDAEIEAGKSTVDNIDLQIDVRMMIQSWRTDYEYRADSAEVFYARRAINLAAEDNPILTSDEIVDAENFILMDPRIHQWLQGTRLSVLQIRKRRAVRWLRKTFRRPPMWHTSNMLTEGNELVSAKQQDTTYSL